MMKYELFKEVVAEKFMDFMPPELQGHKLEIHEVNKVNKKMDALNLVPEDPEQQRVTPNIYINQMYEHYLDCEDLQQVLTDAAKGMEMALENIPTDVPMNMENAKDNIVMMVVNTIQNEEMLKNIPNRPFHDLSIVYRWVVNVDKDGMSSTIVNNALAERIGMSEEEMFKAAVENTKRILPPSVRSMNDVIADIMMGEGMPREVAEIMIGEIPEKQTMWVISNEKGINGAVSMLYEENLHMLAEKMDTDLYILPSSTHEVIAVSAEMGSPEELSEMVNEINMGQVALEERLSNEVYHYDKDLRKLTQATDSPNKRLDGIVAEPQLIYEADKSR